MRGLRSVGLLALYVGAQIVALALAFPFRAEGLATTSSSAQANNPSSPLYLIALIVIAPLAILWIARRGGGVKALRLLILGGIAFSLDITLQATFALALPAPTYLPPFGPALVFDLSGPFAAVSAVSILLALLIEPQWYVVDAAGFLAAGALIAILGISFGILPVFVLLVALAVYDFIAVYRTKHMLSLADVVVDMKLPILMVMPTSSGYDYPSAAPLNARGAAPGAGVEREALFMGLGDVVIPGTLVVSAFAWLPTGALALGVGGNLWVALGTLLGSLVGYLGLMTLVQKGNAHAGLPFLNGGAIGGYVLAYLLLFHSASLGFVLSL
ncbi:MAG TPA: presenilin family intramembrane aspartyl protease PSH [Thermoplasmata archaeon]|nr:presenilin family intramembrane aspartyl protease PSH [Thermoplasmata archaeon]